MPRRDHLLVNYAKFPSGLKRSLADRGIVVVNDDWHPEPELLLRTLACVVDFGGSVKRPAKSLSWRRHMAQAGVPVFTWNRDAPHNNNLAAWRLALFAHLRSVDIYATHSLGDRRWTFADTTLFLPNAADTAVYNLRGEPTDVLRRMRDPRQYRWDVSFFGALDASRYKEARKRTSFFAALAARLEASGIRFRFVDTTREPMTVDEQVELIQTSLINLNFGARCDYQSGEAWGLPERCFGIPACGGLLLTDRRTHNADSFETGNHIEEFSDVDDCVEKVRRTLADFSRSRDVAEAGCRHVLRHHTYANRAETIHRTILEWHAGRRGSITGEREYA